jgi:hypothetical protein
MCWVVLRFQNGHHGLGFVVCANPALPGFVDFARLTLRLFSPGRQLPAARDFGPLAGLRAGTRRDYHGMHGPKVIR